MPIMLHPHLKRGLQLEEHPVDPQDTIESITHIDKEEQVAKRRRIEKIAFGYLQGKRPVILSAGLRGPFNNGWKNPWAQADPAREVYAGKRNIEHGCRARLRRRSTTKGLQQQLERSKDVHDTKKTTSPPIASPETSRAVQDGTESHNRGSFFQESQNTPVTAPQPRANCDSRATQFFSANTGSQVQNRSTLPNPFWLRRPESQSRSDLGSIMSNATDSSPIRTQRGCPASVSTELRITAPAGPFVSTIQDATKYSDSIAPSGSAAMMMSSPMDFVPATYKESITTSKLPPKHLITLDSYQHAPSSPKNASEGQQDGQSKAVSSIPLQLMPARRDSESKEQGLLNSNMSSSTAVRPRTASEAQKVAHHFAERPTSSDPISSTSTIAQGQTTKRPVQNAQTLQTTQLTLVASPAAQSSTGFRYKKVVASKWSFSNAPRSKPRALNSDSSPACKLNPPNMKHIGNHAQQQKAGNEEDPEKYGRTRNQKTTGQPGNWGADPATGRSSRARRESEYSTQAAMLLAQIGFRENTFPQDLTDTPGPLAQSHDDMAQPVLAEQGGTITPDSFLRPQVRTLQRRDSASQGAAMSTQDLFAAASPFAYSTVKKSQTFQRIGQPSTSTLGEKPGENIDSASPSVASPIENMPEGQKPEDATSWSFNIGDSSHVPALSLCCSVGDALGKSNLPQTNISTSTNVFRGKSMDIADNSLCDLNAP